MTLEERSRERRRRMVVNRAKSFQEAEDWDLEFWQSVTPEERLSALVAIRRDVELVRAAARSSARIDRREGNMETSNHELLQRITANPEIFGGKPIIRGLRIPVDLVLGLLAQGVSQDEILDDFPELQPEDVRAAIAYAQAVIAQDSLEAVQV